MKIAVIGSRNLSVDLKFYISGNTTEIISGGAIGIDQFARKFATENGIKYTEILPEYHKYKRNAPLVRNREIINCADVILAFWDGSSAGTKYAIDYAHKNKKPISVYVFVDGNFVLQQI